jgi:branched-chain amino acid transport system ATP-binding protein
MGAAAPLDRRLFGRRSSLWARPSEGGPPVGSKPLRFGGKRPKSGGIELSGKLLTRRADTFGAESYDHLLEVRDIHLSFKGVKAIDGVSFHVDDGELFAIIGPNGAGKTSLFNSINQVYHPQEGEILWKGESLMGVKPNETAERGIARTFQNIALYPHMTVLENILTGRHIRMKSGWLAGSLWVGKAKREEIANREIVESIIDFLEIEQWRKYPVGLLPYGIQKRVELGRALAMEPELLMLDEPVAGMNLEETEDMARFILDVQDELEIAILLVEHDMGLVMDIADRVLVVDFGEQIALGEPSEVQSNPNVIKAYLGEELETAAGERT